MFNSKLHCCKFVRSVAAYEKKALELSALLASRRNIILSDRSRQLRGFELRSERSGHVLAFSLDTPPPRDEHKAKRSFRTAG